MKYIDTLVDTERTRLVEALERLDDEQWNAPSLCAGWRVRDVVIHLLMPYQLSVPRFLVKMAAARFKFDTMADRWATEDTRPNTQLLDAFRGTKEGRFNIPGAPPEAELSHLVVHAEDIYRPLGIDHTINRHSANIVLEQLTTPRARKSLKPGMLDGLAFSANDTGWRHGSGTEVLGSASALITTLAGRAAAVDELSGAGAAVIRRRAVPGTAPR